MRRRQFCLLNRLAAAVVAVIVGAALATAACAAPSTTATTLASGGSIAIDQALSSLSGSVRWASGVVAFSSQFANTAWAAGQAVGYPDTYPHYGDFPTAWASASADDQREFLELS